MRNNATSHNSSTAIIAGFQLAWRSIFKTFSILPRELSSKPATSRLSGTLAVILKPRNKNDESSF
jgi:hypothetical protein